VVDITSVLRSTARPFPTTGADNGTDPTPVEQCRAPASGVEQLQCYCNTSQCGAGMLDAGKALAAVSGPRAQIDLLAGEAVAGTTVQLTGRGSTASPNALIVSYEWSLVSGGGIVTGISSAVNSDTVSLTPSAAGSFTLQLTVTDNARQSQSVQRTVTVSAAPSSQPPPASGGGGGGGASSGAWVAGVALAALLLTALRRRA
jgi:serine protease